MQIVSIGDNLHEMSKPIFIGMGVKEGIYQIVIYGISGVVRCGEGVVYLTSLGHPTDIGLQLDKA